MIWLLYFYTSQYSQYNYHLNYLSSYNVKNLQMLRSDGGTFKLEQVKFLCCQKPI